MSINAGKRDRVRETIGRLCLAAASVISLILQAPTNAQVPGMPSPCQTCAATGCVNPCQPPVQGVDCLMGTGCGEPRWNSWGPIPWQAFGQGEYAGPARLPHVPEYRLRVDDQIEFVYRLKRKSIR
jgi:polysaccharide biosynthesis/export protein